MFFDRAMCVFSISLMQQEKGSCYAGWPWAMYEAVLSRQDLINHPQIDSLSPWSYPHYWPTKDGGLLRSTSEAEGHSCVHGRNHTHTSTMASSGLPNRIVWDICALW